MAWQARARKGESGAMRLRRGWVNLAVRANQFVLDHWPEPLGKVLLWRVMHRLSSRLGVELVGETVGGSLFYCDLRDMIQSRIIYASVWEPSLTTFLRAHLEVGDTFVDVGANIGYFAILAGRIVGPRGHVVAVEASPRIARMLERNVALNELENVRVLTIAASDHPGTVTLFRGPAGNLGRTGAVQGGDEVDAIVPCAPLTQALTAEELRAAKVIKIDVEGMEWLVLRDLLAHAEELRPDVAIIAEVSPDAVAKLGGSVEWLFHEFGRLGFAWSTLDNDYDFTSLYKVAARRPQPGVTLPRTQADVVFQRPVSARVAQALEVQLA